LPSNELVGTGGVRKHVGGTRVLPGRMGEEGVAKLPYERVESEKTYTMEDHTTGAREAVVGSVPAAAVAPAVSHDTTARLWTRRTAVSFLPNFFRPAY
jgi:hypothetical protein